MVLVHFFHLGVIFIRLYIIFLFTHHLCSRDLGDTDSDIKSSQNRMKFTNTALQMK